MRIVSDFYGRLTGAMLLTLAVATRVALGSNSRFNENLILENQRKAVKYFAGLDILSGR